MTLSIIGDAFMAKKLQLTGERIIDGILAFAAAHIAYIYAFKQTTLDSYSLWYVVPSAIALLALYFLVLYNPQAKPELRIGSFVYTLVIIALFVTVLRFVLTDHVPINAIVVSLLGVSLFILSDSLIAFNEFKKELPHAEKFISFTYILAQILLQTTPLLLL